MAVDAEIEEVGGRSGSSPQRRNSRACTSDVEYDGSETPAVDAARHDVGGCDACRSGLGHVPRCAVLDGKPQENAVLITGADQKINWVDPACEVLLGLSLGELRGQLLGSVLAPLIKPDSLSRIQSAVDNNRAFACESFNRRGDGTAYWIECEISPMAEEDDAQTGFAVTLRETTDRRLNELSRKIEADILQMVVNRAPTQEILNALCLLFEAVYPKAICSIMMRDDDADGLKIRAAPTIPPEIADLLSGLVPGPAAGSCGTAVYRGEPVLVYDVTDDPTWAELQHVVEASGLCSCWSHPVILGDKGIVGSFAISSLENRRPNKAEVRLLQLGAYLAGFALQQEWELNRRNLSEIRFRDFAEAAMDWFWETDVDNRLTYVSGQIESFTDLPKEQILGANRMELLAQIADKDSYDLAKRQVRDQMPFKDVEYQTTDKKRWVRVSGRPIYHEDGSFAGYRGTGRDVTGMRAAQAEVEKSERLMRCLTAAAVGQSRTLDQVMNEILRIGRQEMRFDVGAVALVDGTQFSLRAVQGASVVSGMETGAIADLAGSACSRVFSTNPADLPLYLCVDKAEGISFTSLSESHEEFFGTLISVRGQIVGVLAFLNRIGNCQPPGEPERAFLRLAALWIGQQMENDWALKARDNSERRLRDYADAASDWLWETDAEGRFSYISHQVQSRLGLPPRKLLGKTREELISAYGFKGSQHGVMTEIMSHRLPMRHIEFDVLDGLGRRRTIEISGKPVFDTSGAFQGYRGVGSDVTDRKRLDESLAQSQKMETIGQLAAGISHDFKNLLTIMQGNLTLLGRQLAKMPDSDDKIELLDEVLLATRRGTDLTRGLLSLSQRNHLTIDTVDVAGVVEELRGLLERTFPASIKLEILLPEHPVMAECDGSYLHTALLNLALNARDAMPAGGILRLGVDQESRDGMVRLSVSDTGSGIEPDVINRIFEPLFTTKEEGHGSGLGLSMVQSFARAVGGFVTLDSRLGEGTTFQLEIPLARGREAEVPLTNLPPVEADETAFTFAHTILIVDDDPHIRRMLVRTLDRSDTEILEADDVASAEAVLEQKPQIDLLMTDIQMPGGRDGLDLVKSTLSRRDGLPIVVFSGSSNALQKARSALPEKVAVMSKPVDTDRLVSIVESVLTSPRSTPQ